MRYRTQSIAYAYWVVALLLFGLQMVFGLLAVAKYLGPDPLINVLPFDRVKEIHTNLLLVWVLTGFMGGAYWLVPEESRAEIHSPRLAYWQLALWTVAGVTAVVGYLFGWTAGNKLLEQPYPVKIAIVVVMLMFLYNLGMTIWKARRLTTTEGVFVAGLALTALLYLPALLSYDNYTLSIYYRWWTVHLWVEGVWEMIQAGLLAYLLIRLSGADREVLEKWLYVIVGLTFIAGILGTAHHYFWIGVPQYWLPIGAVFSALEPLAFLAMAIYAYSAIRRSGIAHPNRLALHWTIGSTIFSGTGPVASPVMSPPVESRSKVVRSKVVKSQTRCFRLYDLRPYDFGRLRSPRRRRSAGRRRGPARCARCGPVRGCRRAASVR